LSPWGSLEGTVPEAAKSKGRASVRIWRIEQNSEPLGQLVSHQTTAKVDPAGHYLFARVAPGELWVQSELRTGARRSDRWHYVQVEPGKPLQLSLDDSVPEVGEDHAVLGRVDVPAAVANLVSWT